MLCILGYMKAIWVIREDYNFRDQDNYAASTPRLMEEEGFFLDEESAETRRSALEALLLVRSANLPLFSAPGLGISYELIEIEAAVKV